MGINEDLQADAVASAADASGLEKKLAWANRGLTLAHVVLMFGEAALLGLIHSNPSLALAAPVLDEVLADGVTAMNASLARRKVTLPPEVALSVEALAERGATEAVPALLARTGLPPEVLAAATPGLQSIAADVARTLAQRAAESIDPPDPGL